MKVLVFGTGVLGTALLRVGEMGDDTVRAVGREHMLINGAIEAVLSSYEPDVAINAAGVTPAHPMGQNVGAMIEANVYLPWRLAMETSAPAIPLIHVSTDCVMERRTGPSGMHGPPAPYDAIPTPSPTPYGWTKALGETVRRDFPHVTVVRTSFMSPEQGLWRDMRQREHVYAWQQAWWSGSTVTEVAAMLLHLAANITGFGGGVVHLATAAPITKYQAADILQFQDPECRCRVIPVPGLNVDRSLQPDADYILRPFEEALVFGYLAEERLDA